MVVQTMTDRCPVSLCHHTNPGHVSAMQDRLAPPIYSKSRKTCSYMFEHKFGVVTGLCGFAWAELVCLAWLTMTKTYLDARRAVQALRPVYQADTRPAVSALHDCHLTLSNHGVPSFLRSLAGASRKTTHQLLLSPLLIRNITVLESRPC